MAVDRVVIRLEVVELLLLRFIEGRALGGRLGHDLFHGGQVCSALSFKRANLFGIGCHNVDLLRWEWRVSRRAEQPCPRAVFGWPGAVLTAGYGGSQTALPWRGRCHSTEPPAHACQTRPAQGVGESLKCRSGRAPPRGKSPPRAKRPQGRTA